MRFSPKKYRQQRRAGLNNNNIMTPRSAILLISFLSLCLSPRSCGGAEYPGVVASRRDDSTEAAAHPHHHPASDDAEETTSAVVAAAASSAPDDRHPTDNDYETTTTTTTTTSDSSYYVFLQKFPLESSFRMLFHTEVIVCPRETFARDAEFLNMLDDLASNTLTPPGNFGGGSGSGSSGLLVRGGGGSTPKSPFVAVERDAWSRQSEPGCVQLGFAGASCGSACCGSPHRSENTAYALNSNRAVISNAMGEYKELYFYGVSGGGPGPSSSSSSSSSSSGGGGGSIAVDGEDAYGAVCHGHMYAIDAGGELPTCVSDWAGTDYNPLTNNCNTFTSAVLKCVYGMSDAKPNLGISDIRTVTCPSERGKDGTEVKQCVTPAMHFEKINDALSMD